MYCTTRVDWLKAIYHVYNSSYGTFSERLLFCEVNRRRKLCFLVSIKTMGLVIRESIVSQRKHFDKEALF